MLILELAVQAVRGFSPSARIALRPGYVGLASPTELPAPLSGLLSALCYPDGRGGDAAFLAPGQKSGKAGLSVQGNDQGVYRLVKDLGGSGALHRLNRQTNAFEVVTQDSSEMAQFLRASVGFPPRTTFEQLFAFTVGQLPTKRPKPKKAPAKGDKGDKPKPKLASAFDAAVVPAENVEAAQARLAQLEAELVEANHIAEMQFRQDGIQAEVFKLEGELKGVTELRGKVEEMRERVSAMPTPERLGLSSDIFDRMRRFPEEKSRYREAMEKLAAEKEASRSEEVYVPPSVFRDRRFLYSVAGGLALMVLGAFLEGGARYVALLAIPAISFAALLVLRYIEELQHAGMKGATAEVLGGREKKLSDDFALLERTIDAALERAGANSVEDLFAMLKATEGMRPELEQLEAALAQHMADPRLAGLPQDIEHLKAEQEELNDALLGKAGGYMRDTREIERELARVKESIKLAGQPAAAAATAAEEFSAVNTGPGETFEDPMPTLMVLASDLFATDVPSLWAVLQPRVLQYLSALTDRRYHNVDMDKDGRCTVEAPGRQLAAGELPGRDLDLLYLAVRLTVLEKYSAQGKIPVVFEDAFTAALDPTKQPLFGRMLKHLGTLTQVLHVTPAGQNATAADAVVAL